MNGAEFEGMNAREIIDMLNYDCNKNAEWGVFIEELPELWHIENDLKIPTYEYIKWLEDQIL
jgi:hypothetical protein